MARSVPDRCVTTVLLRFLSELVLEMRRRSRIQLGKLKATDPARPETTIIGKFDCDQRGPSCSGELSRWPVEGLIDSKGNRLDGRTEWSLKTNVNANAEVFQANLQGGAQANPSRTKGVG